MSKVIKNGKIITAKETYEADILIEGEKITTIAEDIEEEGAEVINAAGKYVLPGAVDAHIHLEMPFGGTVSADSYESGTKAGACGGVTTVFDFIIQDAGQSIVEMFNEQKETCDPQACIDYSFHVGITDLQEEIMEEELETIVEEGIPNFKAFTAYKEAGMMIDDGVLLDLLEKSKEIGAMISIHAENAAISERRTKQFIEEGNTSAWYHYKSRPEFVEAEAVKRVTHLAKSVDAPLYIVHLACKEGMEEVKKLRDEGYDIYAETCPQYLNFTKDVYKREEGRNFVCSPPMKGQESQDALWSGIESGDISVVATDHCPFQSEEKDWGKDDFSKIPNGCMGIENLYPYMLGKANEGKLSFNKVVELCSTNPAQIFGCGDKKGTIAPGRDADLVIYDPEKEFTVSQDKMHSTVDYTIWDGLELSGYPVMTFSRGKLVYNDGEFVGETGWGEFVSRSLDS